MLKLQLKQAKLRLVEQRFTHDAVTRKLRAEIEDLASSTSDGTKARSWSRKVKSLQLQLHASNKARDVESRLLTAATRNVELLKLQLSAALTAKEVEHSTHTPTPTREAGGMVKDRATAADAGVQAAKWKSECEQWQRVAINAQQELHLAKERSEEMSAKIDGISGQLSKLRSDFEAEAELKRNLENQLVDLEIENAASMVRRCSCRCGATPSEERIECEVFVRDRKCEMN